MLQRANAQPGPFKNAHAHNDYEHSKPLFDALRQGFMSVEADIHLTADNKLLVGHNSVRGDSPSLEKLYLRPLDSLLSIHSRIQPGTEFPFTLMIDLKTEGHQATTALRKLLLKYPSLQTGEVRIVLSGNVPKDELLAGSDNQLLIDGRPTDLGKGIAAARMPWISDRFSNWAGIAGGEVTARGIASIRELADRVHGEGKLLRLWAIPDQPSCWRQLLEAGVDLINTDRLTELQGFLSRR